MSISKRVLNLFVFASFIFLVSCQDDDNNSENVNPECNVPVPSDQHVLVVNEGNFGSVNGSLTLFDTESQSKYEDVVGCKNEGILTGDVVQSVYHDEAGGRLFVVSNNESRILVLNSSTFVQTGIIESNLELPRYVEIVDGKIYVTNWGADFATSFVAVFNSDNLEFQYNVSTEAGTERIYVDQNKIWVINSFTNSVQVFGTSDQEVQNTIRVGQGPSGISSIDEDNVFVLCQGAFGANAGSVYQIDAANFSKTDSLILDFSPNSNLVEWESSARMILMNGSKMYLFNSILELSQGNALDLSPDLNSVYGFSLLGETLWVAETGDFVNNSKVKGFSLSSIDPTLEFDFEAGIGANSFLVF